MRPFVHVMQDMMVRMPPAMKPLLEIPKLFHGKALPFNQSIIDFIPTKSDSQGSL
jgi:hypothetical protein